MATNFSLTEEVKHAASLLARVVSHRNEQAARSTANEQAARSTANEQAARSTANEQTARSTANEQTARSTGLTEKLVMVAFKVVLCSP